MMKNGILRIMALSLSALMLLLSAGCGKAKEELSYVTEYEYVDGDAPTDGNSSDSADTKTNKNSSVKSRQPTTSSRSKKDAEADAKSRSKNLKGRTITYVAYWDAVGRSTEEGKIITKVEEMLNCKFVHRKLNDYKPLYTSILAGNPIADIYATKFEETLSSAAKNYLTPLDTLSNFDFKNSRWNRSSIETNTINGHIYAATSEPQVKQLLMYNKDMFKANNWPDLYEYQKQGKLTWDVLYDVMTKATKLGTENDPMFGLVPNGTIEEFAQVLINANGVCALERNGGTSLNYGLNCEAGIHALNTVQKWNSEKLLFNSDVYGWAAGSNFFSSGRSAMLVGGQDRFSVWGNCSFEFGMVLFPHGPNTNKDLITVQINGESIPAGVKNPNDVALFWDLYQDLKYAGKDFFAYAYDAAPNESIKYAIDRYQNGIKTGNYIHDYATTWGVNLNEYYKQVAFGETTAAAMVKTVEQKVKGHIDDFFK